jgi:hypothetical protein
VERTTSGTDTRRGGENYIRDGYKKGWNELYQGQIQEGVERTISGTDKKGWRKLYQGQIQEGGGGNQRRILGRSGGRKLYEYKPVIIVSFVGSSRNAIHSPAVVFLNIFDICFYTKYNGTDY